VKINFDIFEGQKLGRLDSLWSKSHKTSLLLLLLLLLLWWWWWVHRNMPLECFDIVGCATKRASCP